MNDDKTQWLNEVEEIAERPNRAKSMMKLALVAVIVFVVEAIILGLAIWLTPFIES